MVKLQGAEVRNMAGITFGTGELEALKRFKSNVRMEMLEGQRGKTYRIGSRVPWAVFCLRMLILK